MDKNTLVISVKHLAISRRRQSKGCWQSDAGRLSNVAEQCYVNTVIKPMKCFMSLQAFNYESSRQASRTSVYGAVLGHFSHRITCGSVGYFKHVLAVDRYQVSKYFSIVYISV